MVRKRKSDLTYIPIWGIRTRPLKWLKGRSRENLKPGQGTNVVANGCGSFNGRNLVNGCNHQKMLTVIWYNGNNSVALKYRLDALEERDVTFHGDRGAIVDEAEWDLSFSYNYGADPRDYVKLYPRDLSGSVVWSVRSGWPGKSHIAVEINVYQEGKRIGISRASLRTNQIRNIIAYSEGQRPLSCELSIACFDPD